MGRRSGVEGDRVEQGNRGRGSSVLARLRLTRALEALGGRKLALVTAPGGYGKTTLVREWVSGLAGASYCWLSLDQADASLPIFLQQFARALARHLPPGGLFSLAPDRTPSDSLAVRHLARQICAELQQHTEERLVIVLDDVHHVAAGDEVMTLLDALIQNLPETVHLVIACRGMPRLSVARLHARNEMVHLSDRDLSFTEEEAGQFLAERFGLELPGEVLRVLMEQTEGWVTGLLLLGNLLQARPAADWLPFLKRFRGGVVFDFLISEVFEQQPPQVQEFLLDTCVLSSLHPFVIERLLGMSGAGSVLQDLEARNLFVVPVMEGDGATYRYHHLFQAFLRQQVTLRRGEAALLHLHYQAGLVYEGLGNLMEAVEHYLCAQEYPRATHLMAEQVDSAIKALRHDIVRGWLQRIPAHLHDEDPDVIYTRAQLAGWLAQHDIMPALYQRCLDLYEQREDYNGLTRCLAWVVNRSWKLRLPFFAEAANRWVSHAHPEVATYGRMLKAAMRTAQGEWSEAITDLESLLATIPAATRAYFACMELLAVLCFWRADSRCSLRYGVPQTAGRTAMGDYTWGFYNWLSYCFLGDGLGLEMYQRTFIAQEVSPAMAPLHELIVTLGQGIIHLFHRRWDDALACLEALEPHFTDTGTGYQAFGGEATFLARSEMARVYARLGRLNEAREALQRNVELTLFYPEVSALAFAYMADFLVQAGELDEARRHVNKALSLIPPGLCGIPTISVGCAACKVALAEGDRQAARQHFAKAVTVTRERACPWTLLHVGGAEILPVLVEVARMASPGGAPRQSLYQVMAAQREGLVPMVAPHLGHPDPEVRAAAATILEQIKHGGAQQRVPVLKVYALGPFRAYRHDQSVDSADWKRTKVKLLFIILLLRRGKPIAKDLLTELLWPDAPTTTARNSLRATLHGIRHALEPDLGPGAASRYVTVDRETVALSGLDEVWFDLWEFDDLLLRARMLHKAGQAHEAIGALQAACGLCRGTFLPEVVFADYFVDVRSRTERQFIDACLEVAAAHLREGDAVAAIECARRVLKLDRASEAAYQLLIRAYLDRGERDKAMQAYKTCLKYMRNLLGNEPSQRTRQLLQA